MASIFRGGFAARWGFGLFSTALTLSAVLGVVLAPPPNAAPYGPGSPEPRRIAPHALARPPAQPAPPRDLRSAEFDFPTPDAAPAPTLGASPRVVTSASPGAPSAIIEASPRAALDAAFATDLPPSLAPVPTPRPEAEALTPAPLETVVPAPPPAPPAKPRKKTVIRALSGAKEGEICSDPRVIGVPLQAIADEGGCAIATPVRVKRVAGVALSPQAVGGCGVPQVLAGWIETELQPSAEALLGSRVRKIHQVSAYVCRNRYNAAEAKLSFHATGDALDIAAFELEDGRRVRVLEDWSGEGPAGAVGAAFLQRAWKTACGPFGTVLGPEANAAHKDHFHFDVAQRRGAYCE